MKKEFKIEENLSKDDFSFIKQKVREYNKKYGAKQDKDFQFCIRNEEGEIISGLFGCMFFGFAYIDYLWTDEKYRGQGLATKLMKKIEEEAKENNCKYLLIDTMEYQAPKFYKNYGFTKGLELKNCEGENSHFTLAKEI